MNDNVAGWFYHPQSEDLVADTQMMLGADEARHLSKARRIGVGQLVNITDGNGRLALSKVAAVSKSSVTCAIYEVAQYEPPQTCLSLAVALPKGDRQNVLLDMATQCGVQRIIPLQCDNSVSKVSTRSTNQYQRWQRIIVGATKQSQRVFLPEICQETAFCHLFQQSSSDILTVFGDADGLSLAELSQQICHAGNRDYREILAVVGPEGGFSVAEKALIEQNSVPMLSASEFILRTETAAVAMLNNLFQLVKILNN